MKAHKCIIAKMYTIFRWKMHRMNVRVTRVIESIPVIALPVERKIACMLITVSSIVVGAGPSDEIIWFFVGCYIVPRLNSSTYLSIAVCRLVTPKAPIAIVTVSIYT